jgi:hypothetical protein
MKAETTSRLIVVRTVMDDDKYLVGKQKLQTSIAMKNHVYLPGSKACTSTNLSIVAAVIKAAKTSSG